MLQQNNKIVLLLLCIITSCQFNRASQQGWIESCKKHTPHLIVPSVNFAQYAYRKNNLGAHHYLSPYGVYFGPVAIATIGDTLLNRQHDTCAKAISCALLKNTAGWLSGAYCLYLESKACKLIAPKWSINISNQIANSDTEEAIDHTIADIMNEIYKIDQSPFLTQQQKNQYTLDAQKLLNQANQKLMHIEERLLEGLIKKADDLMLPFIIHSGFVDVHNQIASSSAANAIDDTIANINGLTERVDACDLHKQEKEAYFIKAQKLLIQANKKSEYINIRAEVDLLANQVKQTNGIIKLVSLFKSAITLHEKIDTYNTALPEPNQLSLWVYCDVKSQLQSKIQTETHKDKSQHSLEEIFCLIGYAHDCLNDKSKDPGIFISWFNQELLYIVDAIRTQIEKNLDNQEITDRLLQEEKSLEAHFKAFRRAHRPWTMQLYTSE